MRLQIGLFGRTNVGKSSFLNLVAGQEVAVTSPVPGTTTDVVEKAMELLPVGPVVFLDTAGIDDNSELAGARMKKTLAVFDRADVYVLITESPVWGGYEERIAAEAKAHGAPLISIINKIDLGVPDVSFLAAVQAATPNVVQCSSTDTGNRDTAVNAFKRLLLDTVPEGFLDSPPIIGDLLPPSGLAVLIVPIDLEAPKGRLILPQVQTIRDALDNDAAVLVVKEREFASIVQTLGRTPDLVVCDSQVVLKMTADTPSDVPCTTFSILFARAKGDLDELASGAAVIGRLRSGDRVLIAEACSHHAAQDDIGRVKIPRWLRQFTGADLTIDVCSGREYPGDLGRYRLVIHCGSCMLTRREMLWRLHRAREAAVPVTNYGVAISVLQGVVERVLHPFPSALAAYRDAGAHTGYVN
jgi:[FeFe] hydrogenase H-cluster maturation GTPase HydF